MKLMEEIIEIDQEIKMKQKWVNTRMKLLHEIRKKQSDKPEMKVIIGDFMKQVQPEYPEKLSVEYNRQGDAIPMGMKNIFDEAVPMHMADKYPRPIPMEHRDSNDPRIEELNLN